MASRFATKFDARPLSTPNLAPMIGVLLAVFAGVVAWPKVDRATPLMLPPAFAPVPQGLPSPPIYLSQHHGRHFVDGRGVPRDQVAEALRRAARGREAARVEVRVDPDAPYAEAFVLVRTVEDAGLRPRLVLESGRP
ncbi:hypothetical protein SGCZBJ_15115 [Caulobacter zeae]|uniref:Biopolymer transporter ExbD n=1 Tax=Caulobacter zeae TaxID=2055137 RepID=A0A2N5DD63_9CAUL|nr:hypothetical protein [Caulobacter zeae]PLR23906.1 hypothetical protein SGCZBJ_15115 [Caulobacter zeae]